MGPMGSHGSEIPWDPMGPHEIPWDAMGAWARDPARPTREHEDENDNDENEDENDENDENGNTVTLHSTRAQG